MVVRRKTKAPNELYHHGIKNQHWGVRNGPPYPLDRKTSARIKKGHNEKLRDNKKEGTSHASSALGKSYRYPSGMSFQEAKSYGEKYRDNESRLLETVMYKNDSGETRAANILQIGDVYNLVSNNMKGNDPTGIRLSSDVKKDLRENGFKNQNHLLQMINMDEGEDEYKSTRNNCSKCSDTVELVMRGLDPKLLSAGRSQYGMLGTAQEYHWDGAIPYKEKSLANIENRIKKFGNHASGTIGVRRSDGSGHSMHFSRLKDGTIQVQDGQIGKTYSSIGEALKAEGHDFNQFCKITRLDCATPNIQHMVEDSVVRMDTQMAKRSGYFTPGVTIRRKNGSQTTYHHDKNSFTNWEKDRGEVWN